MKMSIDVSAFVYEDTEVDTHRTAYNDALTPITLKLDGMMLFLSLNKAEEIVDKLQQLVTAIKISNQASA